METLKSNESVIKVILYFLSSYVALYGLIIFVPLSLVFLAIMLRMRRKYDADAMPEADCILGGLRATGTVARSVLRPDGSERIVLIRSADSEAALIFSLDSSAAAPEAGQTVTLYHLTEPLPQTSALPVDSTRRVLFDSPDNPLYHRALTAQTAKNNYQGMRRAAAVSGGIALFFTLLFFGLASPFL